MHNSSIHFQVCDFKFVIGCFSGLWHLCHKILLLPGQCLHTPLIPAFRARGWQSSRPAGYTEWLHRKIQSQNPLKIKAKPLLFLYYYKAIKLPITIKLPLDFSCVYFVSILYFHLGYNWNLYWFKESYIIHFFCYFMYFSQIHLFNNSSFSQWPEVPI